MSQAPNDHDVELDGNALALLQALRAEEDIPPAVHDRVWARLDAEVGHSRSRPVVAWMVGGLAAAAAVALSWTSFREPSRAETRPPSSMQAPFERDDRSNEHPISIPRSAADDPPARAREPAADPATVIGTVDEAPTRAENTESAGRATPSAKRARKKPVRGEEEIVEAEARTDPLAEEMALLKQAKLALSRAEPKRALTLLEEHADRFPRGVLLQERKALRVVALCDAGDRTRGREAAERFSREHPKAALAERVRAACRD